MTAEQLLNKAVTSLLFSEPFYATLLLQMQRVAVGPEVCDVAAVDGKHLFYNPDAIVKYNFDQLKTILMHECGHMAYAHHVRMIGKDQKLSNIAGDHVVNLPLKAAGYTPVDGWLCDQRFAGMPFEKVYAILEAEQQKQKGGGGQQPPQKPAGGKGQPQKSPPGGQPQPGAGKSGNGKPQPQAASTPGGFGQIIPCRKDEAVAQEQEWKMAVETAATAAKAAGKLPGHLARMVEELRESKVDWKEILKQFLANQIPTDFTWNRPSKRTLSQGIYLPSQMKEGLGDLIFLIDMSGSCLGYITPFSSEVGVVHQDFKPSKLTLLSFDTRVHDCGEFGPGEEIEFKLKGGGGTDFRPIFERIAEMDTQPKAVVILTDLYGPFPAEAPDYPVLWVSTTREVAPFGETCKMEV